MLAYKVSFTLGGKTGHFFAPEEFSVMSGAKGASGELKPTFAPIKDAKQAVLVTKIDHMDGGLFKIVESVLVPLYGLTITEGEELPRCTLSLSNVAEAEAFVIGYATQKDTQSTDRYVALKIFDGE